MTVVNNTSLAENKLTVFLKAQDMPSYIYAFLASLCTRIMVFVSLSFISGIVQDKNEVALHDQQEEGGRAEAKSGAGVGKIRFGCAEQALIS